MIPVSAPGRAYQRHRAEIDAAMRQVMESGQYILGPQGQAFEHEFGASLGLPETAAVASGTEALWLALRAAGIGPGAEVIMPTLTATATAAAVVECGARPVFADVRELDLNLDASQLHTHLTPATRAVVAVHLYGHPAEMDAIASFCGQHNLVLIEDCAQAHGTKFAGQPVGTFGLTAAWSFYPTKNLGAFGDGGLMGSKDASLAERVRLWREYGWRERGLSLEHGWNSRLDELQASILRVRLKHLAPDNTRRRAIAAAYRGGIAPNLRGPVPAGGESVEHLFVVRHDRREALRHALAAAGVGTAVHYSPPCHLQPAYQPYGKGPGSLPVAERASQEVFSLPMFPELTDAEVEHVISAVNSVLATL